MNTFAKIYICKLFSQKSYVPMDTFTKVKQQDGLCGFYAETNFQQLFHVQFSLSTVICTPVLISQNYN